MSDEFRDILGEQRDAHDLLDTARMLSSARPLPTPAFRGQMRRRIESRRPARAISHLRLKILSLAGAGLLALGIAAAGVAGSGPLAPSAQPGAQTASASIDR